MNKLWIFLAVFVVLFSAAYAEGGNGNNGGNNTPECTVDIDCDADEVCISGECEDSETVEENETPECTLDADCTGGKICLNGECERPESNESEDDCTIDADCDNNEICISGECEDADENENETENDVCTVTADCDDDEICLNGECEDADDDENETQEDRANRTKWIKDCVDDSEVEKVNELMSKIRKAEASGQPEGVAELRREMQEASNRIRVKVEECGRLRTMNQGFFVSQAVKYKNGSAAEIVEYYKLKLSEIAAEPNETLRLQMLRELRDDIDTEIKNIMERNREIRSKDVDDLVEEIEVKGDKIKADDVEINSADKVIITEINGKEVKIKVLNGIVKIETEGSEVDASAITVKENTLYYEGVAIKTLPSDVALRYKMRVTEMELEQEEGRVSYKVKYDDSKRVLGIFKAKAHREAQVDPATGEEIENKGPWWTFLATDDKSEDEPEETTADTAE